MIEFNSEKMEFENVENVVGGGAVSPDIHSDMDLVAKYLDKETYNKIFQDNITKGLDLDTTLKILLLMSWVWRESPLNSAGGFVSKNTHDDLRMFREYAPKGAGMMLWVESLSKSLDECDKFI